MVELYYSKSGIKCAVFGPGSKKVIHRPNEYVNISNLKKAENIYKKVMLDWCFRSCRNPTSTDTK